MPGNRQFHWYVKIPKKYNESFVRYLTQRGGGDELCRAGLEEAGHEGTKKVFHDVWYLNGTGLRPSDIKEIAEEMPGTRLFRKRGSETKITDVTFMIESKAKKEASKKIHKRKVA